MVSAESRSAALSVVVFIVIFALLQAAIIAVRGGDVERLIVHHVSARPAAMLLTMAGAEDAPRAHATRLTGRARTLTVEAGCDGTETLALLISALAALRLPVRRSVALLSIGVAAVLVLNVVRIAALWWALGTNTRVFDVIHGQIAPAILISAVGVIVLLATRTPATASSA